MVSRVPTTVTSCYDGWRVIYSSCILLLISLIGATQGQGGGITLTPDEFFNGIQEMKFDVIVDVRSVEEFNSGHIENATLVANLASTPIEASKLMGCETCTLVVYCRSGARASSAIRRLQNELGFNEATLYNGLGTSQWTDAGYPLVTNTPSIDAPCNNVANQDYTCIAKQDAPTFAPTTSPSTSPSTIQPSTSPSEENVCKSFDNFCIASTDCCSGRCLLNACKKKIPERKQSLASNMGGSAGARKAGNRNRNRRRYLKSRAKLSAATTTSTNHRRVKGSVR